LIILDPNFSNFALGEKILWRLVTKKLERWKKDLFQKYLAGDRLLCLNSPLLCQPSSPIWNLMKASLPLFQNKITWIPKNDRNILLWTDNIMENPPLLQELSLLPLFQ
jgi:hypothetical protein